ncbi:MAG: outer membrane beta-barrel protein [Flavobacteriales bacterium]|nr:outer membrane beta-barrel protein [Flavobacteriales bacterium]
MAFLSKISFLICLCGMGFSCMAQTADTLDNNPADTSVKKDTKKAHKLFLRQQKSKYLDDQLYISFSYNILTALPDEMREYSFSNTFALGYIRDIPLNKRRNIGLGIGAGLGFHSYYTNLSLTKDEFGVLDIHTMGSDEYKSNRFSLQTVDFPIQLRFRGSTADKFNFWRVYAGITASWVYKNSATIKTEIQKIRYYDISPLQTWLFMANLQVGYGKFTVKVDYSINSLFERSYNGAPLAIDGLSNVHTCNVGLLVYIL